MPPAKANKDSASGTGGSSSKGGKAGNHELNDINSIKLDIINEMGRVLDEKLATLHSSIKRVGTYSQSVSLLNRYKNDELEQYGRRENIRVHGLPEDKNEDLSAKFVQLMHKISINITSGDISVIHRVKSKKKDVPRQVIVRFVRRQVRTDIMRKKKALNAVNEKEKTKIFLTDDLTPLRSTLLRLAKDHSNVKSAYTIEGKIHVKLRDNPEESVVINNPDDLWKIGIVEPDWKELGLLNYIHTHQPPNEEE
jgi:hypothetical protein